MIRRLFIVALATCLMAGGAHAFEKSGSDVVTKSLQEPSKPLDLSTGTTVDQSKKGPGISFPGLGSLGVLPKLDFGLELLYGENQPQAVEPQDDETDAEGLRIRGTLKHRF